MSFLFFLLLFSIVEEQVPPIVARRAHDEEVGPARRIRPDERV